MEVASANCNYFIARKKKAKPREGWEWSRNYESLESKERRSAANPWTARLESRL